LTGAAALSTIDVRGLIVDLVYLAVFGAYIGAMVACVMKRKWILAAWPRCSSRSG
jgi:hypothetical protein